MTSGSLVSVVIPAFNAAATMDATMRSVRAQTYACLEIIVVDDGSNDATPDIVSSHLAIDPRIRLLRQTNGGVAEARNRGWREASGDLIAFIDADDLWAADKIEKQLNALEKAGAYAALAYTWYAVIDEKGLIIERLAPDAAGRVLERLLLSNFIGNGSSTLIRKEPLIAAGGFDPALRARDAEGCEDLLLYLRVAERHEFALVPEYLTGYRMTPKNMSSDPLRMLRSWRLVAAEMRARHPEHTHLVAEGVVNFTAWLLQRAVKLRRPGDIMRLGLELGRERPRLAAGIMFPGRARCWLRNVRRLLRGLPVEAASPAAEPAPFAVGEPGAGP
jgi:glycosyltransferase involved in cell wall biosynthesis